MLTLGPRQLYILYSFSAGIDVRRCNIDLKVDPRAVKAKELHLKVFFYPLEVVSRYRDLQLQVVNHSYL